MREFLFEKFIKGSVELLIFLKLAKWSKKIDLNIVDPRAKAMIEAAKKLNIKIFNLRMDRKQTEIFKAVNNDKSIVFKHLPKKVKLNSVWSKYIDDKLTSKKILVKNDLPVSRGFAAKNYSSNLEVEAAQLGYPLIAKPRRGSLSQGVIREINNKKELKKVLDNTKCQMMIEKKYFGEEYRVTLVAGKLVAACLREPAKVVGNGKNTIEKLIEKKNKKRSNQRSSTKKKITKVNKDIDLKRVPRKSEKVFLTDNVNLASGADLIDLTDRVCSVNRKMFEKVANLFQTDIIGIDYISDDISKPFFKANGVIIELNSLPYINMHTNPTKGKSREVAEKLWQTVFG
jgi:cyanophycin synthetase